MARKRRKPSPDHTSCLSQTQVQKLLAHVQRRADQGRRAGTSRAIIDELIVLTLLHAGLRARELCSLHMADTPAGHGKPELHVRNPRRHTCRIVSLPPELVPAFQRFGRLYRAGAQPTDPLFLSERGSPFGYISLYSKIRRIGREAGLGRLHPALLRHTFLMRLYEKEQDLRLVQNQAGHARLKSTASLVRPRPSIQRCEACGKAVASGRGVKIDSGQLLCPSCLRELRNR